MASFAAQICQRGGGAGRTDVAQSPAQGGHADESDPDRLGHGADARSRCLRAGAGTTDAVVHLTRVDGAATGRRAPRSPGPLGEQQRHAARASARAGRQAAAERGRARGAEAEGRHACSVPRPTRCSATPSTWRCSTRNARGSSAPPALTAPTGCRIASSSRAPRSSNHPPTGACPRSRPRTRSCVPRAPPRAADVWPAPRT